MRLAVCVEGQTEEEFVKSVLGDLLAPCGVAPDPILIGIGRGEGGGGVTVRRLAFEMAGLYHTHDAVTSLVDFYGFQNRGGRSVEALEAHLREKVGERVGEGWDASRVFPYVQMHEFEGLLFSDVEVFANQIGFPDDCADVLRAVRAQFTNPEDINDHPETAPSKRIAGVIPKYKKVVHGPMLAEEIGLATIRAECPRFDAWVTRLQSLGTEQTDVAVTD